VVTKNPNLLVPPWQKAEIGRSLAGAERRGGVPAKHLLMKQYMWKGYDQGLQYKWLKLWVDAEKALTADDRKEGRTAYEGFTTVGAPLKFDYQAQTDLIEDVRAAAAAITPGSKEWADIQKTKVEKRQCMGSKELKEAMQLRAQETTQRRTGKSVEKKPIDPKTYKKWVNWLGLKTIMPDWITDARAAVHGDKRAGIAQAVMMSIATMFPGKPGETLDKCNVWNLDAMTNLLERSSNGDGYVYVPEDYYAKVAVPCGGLNGHFSFKHYMVMSVAGAVPVFVSVIGDDTLPKDAIMKMPVKGWGPSSEFIGHIWICKSTHPTQEFYDQLFTEIIIPAIIRHIANLPPRADGLLHAGLFMADGEKEQMLSMCSEKVKKLFAALMWAMLKHHRSASALWQLNDVAKIHQIIHKVAKSGKFAIEAEWYTLQNIQTAFDKQVEELKRTHPGYTPTQSLKTRLTAGVRILQPIIRHVCSMNRVIREGAELCGFMPGLARCVELDIPAILRRCKAFDGCSPREIDGYVAVVKRLAAKGHLENWCEASEEEMDAALVEETEQLRALRANPNRVQPKWKALSHRRTVLLTHWCQAHFQETKRLHEEQVKVQKAAAKAKKAEVAKAKRSGAAALDRAQRKEQAVAEKAAKAQEEVQKAAREYIRRAATQAKKECEKAQKAVQQTGKAGKTETATKSAEKVKAASAVAAELVVLAEAQLEPANGGEAAVHLAAIKAAAKAAEVAAAEAVEVCAAKVAGFRKVAADKAARQAEKVRKAEEKARKAEEKLQKKKAAAAEEKLEKAKRKALSAPADRTTKKRRAAPPPFSEAKWRRILVEESYQPCDKVYNDDVSCAVHKCWTYYGIEERFGKGAVWGAAECGLYYCPLCHLGNETDAHEAGCLECEAKKAAE
jgi:hypothetical protein